MLSLDFSRISLVLLHSHEPDLPIWLALCKSFQRQALANTPENALGGAAMAGIEFGKLVRATCNCNMYTCAVPAQCHH